MSIFYTASTLQALTIKGKSVPTLQNLCIGFEIQPKSSWRKADYINAILEAQAAQIEAVADVELVATVDEGLSSHDEELSGEMVAADECIVPSLESTITEIQQARHEQFIQSCWEAEELQERAEMVDILIGVTGIETGPCAEPEASEASEAPLTPITTAIPTPQPFSLTAVALAMALWLIVEVTATTIITTAALTATIARWAYRVTQTWVKARKIGQTRSDRLSEAVERPPGLTKVIWALG